MLTTTLLYGGLLGLLSLGLSARAGLLRGKLNVSVGDGGNADLLLEMRRHANFVEYVPLALLLIAMIEIAGGPTLLVHALGAGLLLTRASHALTLDPASVGNPGRIVGAAGTALVTLIASLYVIVLFF